MGFGQVYPIPGNDEFISTLPGALFDAATPAKKVLGFRLNDVLFANNNSSAGELIFGDIKPAFTSLSWYTPDPLASPYWTLPEVPTLSVIDPTAQGATWKNAISFPSLSTTISFATPFIALPLANWTSIVNLMGFTQYDSIQLGSDGLHVITFCCSNPPRYHLEAGFGTGPTVGALFEAPYFRLPSLSDAKQCGQDPCQTCPEDDTCVLMLAGIPANHPEFPADSAIFGTKFLSKFYTVFDYSDPEQYLVGLGYAVQA